jgi:hypothetical protein
LIVDGSVRTPGASSSTRPRWSLAMRDRRITRSPQPSLVSALCCASSVHTLATATPRGRLMAPTLSLLSKICLGVQSQGTTATGELGRFTARM